MRGVDVCVDAELFVGAEGHDNFFERCVAGTFADAVDGHFGLTGAVDDAADGVGGGHAQVVVAVSGYGDAVNAVDVFHQIAYFRAEIRRQAVAGSVGNIHNRSSGFDDGFDYSGEIFIVGATGILGIKLYVLDEFLRVADARYGAFENLFACRVEFVADMVVARAYACVDAFVAGIFQRIGCHADVVLNGARQGAHSGPRHRLANLYN